MIISEKKKLNMILTNISLRLCSSYNRLLWSKFRSIKISRNTHTAVKEECATELLNTYNQDIMSGGVVPMFRRALLFPSRVALQDEFGIYTYAGLHQAATALSKDITSLLIGDTLRTIVYLCGNDASHVIVQWAIWMTGNTAVPLTSLHPPDMLKYFMTDSMCKLAICTEEYEKILTPICADLKISLLVTSREKEITAQLYQPNTAFLDKSDEVLIDVGKKNKWYGNAEPAALIIYTSGTTSKPKGVVWTHSMLNMHIMALHSAWQYSANDVVLHTLPLHHIHGQLNSLNASLAAGARVRMMPSFVSHAVWSRLLGMGEQEESRITVFHGVPAMYAKLANDYDKMFASSRTADYVRSALLGRMRLMCAGSAPLPKPLFHKWEKISGLRLLERYGMSEVGMALSNPYRPMDERTVGCVGLPLPGMEARIATASENDPDRVEPLLTVKCPAPELQISLEQLGLGSSKQRYEPTKAYEWKQPEIKHHQNKPEIQGELLLKGPGVFRRYMNQAPTLDSKDFTSDGWFRTGDTASFENGKFRILGRTSVDIIKTSGYKVSALQLESVFLENPDIADVAVVGIEDQIYGELVAVALVLKPNVKLTTQQIKDWTANKLASYQTPRIILILSEMPRNHMGKLDKKEIKQLILESKRNSN